MILKPDWMGLLGRMFTVLAAVSVGLLGLLVPTAVADVGVGIQSDPIVVQPALSPGSSRPAPAVYVVNKGAEPESIGLHIQQIGDTLGSRPVPQAWVVFDPPQVRLDPGKDARLALTVTVPEDAASGGYSTQIVASAVSVGPTNTGAHVGAGAATKLQFTVTGGSAWPHPPLWVLLVLGGVAVVLLVVWLARRFGLSLKVERNS